MYRCEVCQEVSKPGEPQHHYAVMRAVRGPTINVLPRSSPVSHDTVSGKAVRQEVDRELAVCTACNDALTHGIPLSVLLTQRGKPKVVRVQTVHVPYLETVPVVPPQTQRRVTFGAVETARWQSAVPNHSNLSKQDALYTACDVCGKDATGGQSTVESVLCVDCCRRANGGAI
jgi:hypothetical protein